MNKNDDFAAEYRDLVAAACLIAKAMDGVHSEDGFNVTSPAYLMLYRSKQYLLNEANRAMRGAP